MSEVPESSRGNITVGLFKWGTCPSQPDGFLKSAMSLPRGACPDPLGWGRCLFMATFAPELVLNLVCGLGMRFSLWKALECRGRGVSRLSLCMRPDV